MDRNKVLLLYLKQKLKYGQYTNYYLMIIFKYALVNIAIKQNLTIQINIPKKKLR